MHICLNRLDVAVCIRGLLSVILISKSIRLVATPPQDRLSVFNHHFIWCQYLLACWLCQQFRK